MIGRKYLFAQLHYYYHRLLRRTLHLPVLYSAIVEDPDVCRGVVPDSFGITIPAPTIVVGAKSNGRTLHRSVILLSIVEDPDVCRKRPILYHTLRKARAVCCSSPLGEAR